MNIIRWDDFVAMGHRRMKLLCDSKAIDSYKEKYPLMELNGIRWNIVEKFTIQDRGGENFRANLIKEIINSPPGVIGIRFFRYNENEKFF